MNITNPLENPLGFLIDIFFLLIDGVTALWGFMTYEIEIISEIDFGIFSISLPFALPQTVSVIGLMGGAGLTVLMIIAFLKTFTPFL